MTNELIKAVSQKLDKLANFKKWVPGLAGDIIEMFDGKMFEGFLLLFKTKVYDGLSDEHKADVDTLLLAFVTGDWSSVDEALITRVNALVNIPELNEEEEGELFGGIIKCIFKYIQRKGGQAQAKDGDPGEGPKDPDPDK